MPKCEKLLQRARRSPKGLRFEELCQLAECFGFVFDHQRGSHRMYKRPGYPWVANLVEGPNGEAKEYQVKNMLTHIQLILELDEVDGAD